MYVDPDIDECSNNADLCDNGECVNLNASYTCDCDTGYTGDSCESGNYLSLRWVLANVGITTVYMYCRCYYSILRANCTTG